MNQDIKNIRKTGDEQVIKLKQIVEQTIAEESLIIENLVNEPKEVLTRGQNISDKIASFGGS
jgi:uncharacterized membrane protein